MEEGTLSIVRRGTCYQVRYASNNLHEQERRPYACPDEADLTVLLHHCGTELALISEVCTNVREGKMAVLLVVVSVEQLQAFFPPAHQAQASARKARGEAVTRREEFALLLEEAALLLEETALAVGKSHQLLDEGHE